MNSSSILESPRYILWSRLRITFLWRVRKKWLLLVETGARSKGSLNIFDEKPCCPQNCQDGRTDQLRLWRNGEALCTALKACTVKLSKEGILNPEESTGVSDSPVEYIGGFQSGKTVLRALHFFPKHKYHTFSVRRLKNDK